MELIKKYLKSALAIAVAVGAIVTQAINVLAELSK